MPGMEIDIELIRLFQQIDSFDDHPELQQYIQELDQYSMDQFFDSKKNEIINRTIIRIHELVAKIKHSIAVSDESNHECISLLKTINERFEMAILDGDVKHLIIFFALNSNTGIKPKNFLEFLKGKKNIDSAPLAANIEALLNRFTLEITLVPNSDQFEEKLYNNYREGLLKEDLKKVYRFINAVERGGRGFRLNYLMESLISFLFVLDSPTYLKFLNKQAVPHKIIMCLVGLDKKSIRRIALSKIDNKWLLAELIRFLSVNFQNEEIAQIEKPLLNCLNLLHTLAPLLYQKTILLFHDSKALNNALGLQHKSIHKKTIFTLMNALPIDKYEHRIQARSHLISRQKELLPEPLYKKILEIVFDKWSKLYDGYKVGDELLITLLITDYGDYIAEYYSMLDPSTFITEFKSHINKLLYLQSEWFDTDIQQITGMHLYLSKIYIISFAFKTNSIFDESSLAEFTRLNKGKYYFLKSIKNLDEIMETISNNINIESTQNVQLR